EQLVFELVARSPPVLSDEVGVGECRLRILVEHLRIRMRGRAIEIEVVFLDVLAVVALAVGEAEEPLLQDGVALVPQRERKAEQPLVVAKARDAVFAAVVGARASLVVGQVVPSFALAAHVFAHGPPLSFAQVGPPLLPGSLLLASFGEASMFSRLSFHERKLRRSAACASPTRERFGPLDEGSIGRVLVTCPGPRGDTAQSLARATGNGWRDGAFVAPRRPASASTFRLVDARRL